MYTIFHDELSHLPYLTGRDQERSSNMAKNFGKILLGLTAAGAAGAGAYYWLKNRKTSSMTLLKRMILNWMMILAKCLSVVTQLLLHLLQRKKPLKSLKKKLTMQKPDQKPLPRHRKLIPKNPIRLQKKFKKELFLQLIIFCIKPKPGRIFHSYRVFHCHFFSKTVD